MIPIKISLIILSIAFNAQPAFAEKQARYLLGEISLPSKQSPNAFGSYSKETNYW